MPQKYHLEKVERIIGFCLENAEPGQKARVLSNASLTSDHSLFHPYIEQITNLFLNKAGVFVNEVFQFLIIIHEDLSADIYINDFRVNAEGRIKSRAIAGEPIKKKDLIGLRTLSFPDIEINTTDKIIYCFKVGWKFGLHFHLHPKVNLDIKRMQLNTGNLYRYLLFQDVYETMTSESLFNEILKDGWFPFIELVGGDFKVVAQIYSNKHNFQKRINAFLEKFNNQRINQMTDRWWQNDVFNEKKDLLNAGVKAYLMDNKDGYINCINTLIPQIEGIIRYQYFKEKKKGVHVKENILVDFLIEKGKEKSGDNYSLFMPLQFKNYLVQVFFANFNLEKGQITLSRHSSSHGVATVIDYDKIKALQMILILDQISFYTL